VHIEAAFGTLRKQSSVDDALRFEDLQFVRALGAGSYGEVGLYRWKPGSTLVVGDISVPRTGEVAVKCLLPAASKNRAAIADFKAEVAVLSKLSHSCIAGCIGTGVRPDPNVSCVHSTACRTTQCWIAGSALATSAPFCSTGA
jgi:serine/threonine protein kinase